MTWIRLSTVALAQTNGLFRHTCSWLRDDESIFSKKSPSIPQPRKANLRGVIFQDTRLDPPRSDRGGLGVAGIDGYLSEKGGIASSLLLSRAPSQFSMLTTASSFPSSSNCLDVNSAF